MSGNFVQRGFPSILDKWTKANMAISNGVDLVIELPTLYSLSSAEFFFWSCKHFRQFKYNKQYLLWK